jgi:hypothetical protein
VQRMFELTILVYKSIKIACKNLIVSDISMLSKIERNVMGR